MQKKHPHQFTLFVLGYAAVQGIHSTPVSSAFPEIELPTTSHMEIAEIHGKPYKEYSGYRKASEQRVQDYSAEDPKDIFPVSSGLFSLLKRE